MKIVAIRQRTLPVARSARNAAISFESMTVSIVAVMTDQVREGHPVVGYGVDSAGRYGHGGLLAERFTARVLAASADSLLTDDGKNFSPDRVLAAAMRNEKPGGHGERAGAIGLLDTAIWDIVGKLKDQPLWRVLADGELGLGPRVRGKVPTYASGGYYTGEESDHRALISEMRKAADAGHTHFKIKGGMGSIATDRRRIEAALTVAGAGDNLALDLSGTFDLDAGAAYLKEFEPYRLRWVEEVGDPLDFDLQAALAGRYSGSLATGENLFSFSDATNLLRYGGLRADRDFLQFDIALSYGLVEYRRILAMLDARGWARHRSTPHSGHLLSLHAIGAFGLASHETGMNPSGIFGGYPDGCRVENGFVTLPEAPGVGFETKPELFAELRSLTE